MGLFNTNRGKNKRNGAKRLRKAWWEIAAEFPAEELFYDPTLDPAASAYDPLGSYTGRPVDGGQPVQDADDL